MKNFLCLSAFLVMSIVGTVANAQCIIIGSIECEAVYDHLPCSGNMCEGTWNVYCPSAYKGYSLTTGSFDIEVDISGTSGPDGQHNGSELVVGGPNVDVCQVVFDCDSTTACTAANGFACVRDTTIHDTYGVNELLQSGDFCDPINEI